MGSVAVLYNRGVIFSGMSGSANKKTTILQGFMQGPHVKYLSDDLMIAHQGRVYGIPSLIPTRKHTFSFLRDPKVFMDPFKKYKGRVIDYSEGDFDVFLLVKSHLNKLKRISHEEGINKLSALNNKIHPFSNERVVSCCPFVHAELSFDRFFRKQKSIL